MDKVFAIDVNNVRKQFKDVIALDDISLKFTPGIMHGIIGPEGAGKTTLLRIILGLLKPSSGAVEFSVDNHSKAFADIRADIAYMPQQESLYADLSIGEHLEFFRQLYGIDDDFYQQKCAELLHITRLSKFVDRPAGKLSGGMYKKLGLICALLRSPRVILLDEPTNGVDPISRREFWDLLYKLADEKILILVTTAYMDEAERCSFVHLMENGKIIEVGEPRVILDKARVKTFDEFFLQRGKHDYS